MEEVIKELNFYALYNTTFSFIEVKILNLELMQE